jgi:transposase
VGLFREVVARGYPGSRMTVERFLRGLRALEQQGVPIRSVTPATVELTPRRAIGLMLRRREDLTEEEAAALKRACQVHPHVQQTQNLLQEFASMVRERRGEDLQQWMAMAFHCGIAEWRPFVRKLRQDQGAVQGSYPPCQGMSRASGSCALSCSTSLMSFCSRCSASNSTRE